MLYGLPTFVSTFLHINGWYFRAQATGDGFSLRALRISDKVTL